MFDYDYFCKNLDTSKHNLKSWNCFCPTNTSAKDYLNKIKNGWLSIATMDSAKKMSQDPNITENEAIEMIRKMEIEAYNALEAWRTHY